MPDICTAVMGERTIPSILFRVSRRGLLICALAMHMSSPHAAEDPQALLAASDAIRNPSQPYRMTVTLTEYEKGKQVSTMTLSSLARLLDKTGQYATILRFVQPARDAGKVMMRNGSELWFFDPSTAATVQISAQQRLMGQAANGDVLTVNFARDYKARLVADENIQDGERKSRRSVRLHLDARNEEAAYASIELWLDASTSMPIKAQFFADSGRMLKTAYYRRIQQQLGADRPTEAVIIDGLEPQSVTVVRYSDFSPRNVPLNWFQRDYLSRFSTE